MNHLSTLLTQKQAGSSNKAERIYGRLPVEPMPGANFINTSFNHYALLEIISTISTACFYVIDRTTRKVCYASANDHFLQGCLKDGSLPLDSDLFTAIIYEKDLALWKKMNNAIWSYLSEMPRADCVDGYFHTTFRLKRNNPFHGKQITQMVSLCQYPMWECDEVRWMIVSMRASSEKESGNLSLRSKCHTHEWLYHAKSEKWVQSTKKTLTEREKTILILALQEKTVKEMAAILHRSQDTIENQIGALYNKLEVGSMAAAINVAVGRGLLYITHTRKPKTKEASNTHKKSKRKRICPEADLCKQVETELALGKSIRHTAKTVGISEGTIRAWIKQYKVLHDRNFT